MMSYHYTPAKEANIKETDNTTFWQGYELLGLLTHFWWKCKTVWQLLLKLNTCLF